MSSAKSGTRRTRATRLTAPKAARRRAAERRAPLGYTRTSSSPQFQVVETSVATQYAPHVVGAAHARGEPQGRGCSRRGR